MQFRMHQLIAGTMHQQINVNILTIFQLNVKHGNMICHFTSQQL